jgi:hypothetical protein
MLIGVTKMKYIILIILLLTPSTVSAQATTQMAVDRLVSSANYLLEHCAPIESSQSPGIISLTSKQRDGQIKLSWTKPTKRDNGDDFPNSELRGYVIVYYSMIGGRGITNINKRANSYPFGNLKPGRYYFAIATIDTDGLKSEWSDEISVVVGGG